MHLLTPSTKAFLCILAMLALFIGSQLGIPVLMALMVKITGGTLPDDKINWLGEALLLCNLILIACLLLFQLVRQCLLTPHAQSASRQWGFGLLGFVCIAVGANLLLTPLELDDNGAMAMFGSIVDNPFAILCLCLVGPLAEELVFREGIQRRLGLAGLKPWLAIALSAFVFAVMHGNIAQGVMAMSLGALLGVLYHQTGDIRLSLPAHVLNNTLGVLLLIYPAIGRSFESMPFWWGLKISASLFAIGCLFFYLWWRSNGVRLV